MTENVLTWKDIISATDISKEYDNVTFDVLYMVERTEEASRAVEKFYHGAKEDPLNAVKPVTYEEILRNLKNFSERPLHTGKKLNNLYNVAASESFNYLEVHDVLPRDWIILLIKLQILYLISIDIFKREERIIRENNLESIRHTLILGEQVNKSSVKSSAKGNAVYDVCNPGNVYVLKKNSRLKPPGFRNSNLGPPVIVEQKHMYFVIIGFYDFNLFENLCLSNLSVSAFVEVVESEFENTCMESCNPADCNDMAVYDPAFQVNTSALSVKGKVLLNFWKRFYQIFESDEYAECFENTFHMTIYPNAEALTSQNVTKSMCYNTFLSICSEIVRVADIQRQYANYIRNLKICEINWESKCTPIGQWTLYNHMLNLLPPECFTVSFLLHCMIETVHSSTLKLSKDSNVFHNYKVLSKNEKKHLNLKSCAVDALSKCANVNNVTSETGIEDLNCKLCLSISRKNFSVHEGNDIYIKVSPYDTIRTDYLKTNLRILEGCFPLLLWNKISNIDECKVLLNKYNLKNIAENFDIPLQELQYIIHAIFFNLLKCQCQNENVQRKSSLVLFFPKLKDTYANVTRLNLEEEEEDRYRKYSIEEVNLKIPEVEYLNDPNVYEAKNISMYKWYEQFSPDVMVQFLRQASQDYLCIDFKYCAFDDSILLRYHNNVDKFGINRKTWNQSLRTYVGIKDFCKYIVHEDSSWVKSQEENCLKKCNKEYEIAVENVERLREEYYRKLEFSDSEFIQRGSFKDKQSLPRRFVKSKVKVTRAEVLPILEKLAQPVVPSERKKLSIHCAETEPFGFYAYDHSKSRSQLTGSTIVFCSQDGIKITVDQTKLSKESKNLSLKILAGGHSFILHKNDRTWLEPFTFHICLFDQTIIAFAKPYKRQKPEVRLSEKVCQAAKKKLPERQNLYFVSQIQRHVSKCFNIPFITKRHLILSEELLKPFLYQVGKRGISINMVPSRESLNLKKELQKTSHVTYTKTETTDDFQKLKKLTIDYDVQFKKKTRYEHIVKQSESYDVTNVSESSQSSPRKTRKYDPSEEVLILKKTNKRLIKLMRDAMVYRLPIFKICSSKLHKFKYVKRVKSYIEFPVGTMLKRLSIKPRLEKTGSKVNIAKLLPIKSLTERNEPKYEFKMCFPTGLTIESMSGFNAEPLFIRQSYTDKGPQCKNIANEISRTFMRNGTIFLKKQNGNFDILYINGQMAQCVFPALFEKRSKKSVSTKNPKNDRGLTNLSYLHAFGGNSNKFKKYLQRIVHRLQTHLVGESPNKSFNFSSYAKCKSKRYHIPPDSVYILQTSVSPCKKFSLITSDGKKLKVTKTSVINEKKFHTSTKIDYRYQEMFFEREDGTHMIFNRESELFTQFPDGTRITSWVEIEDELVYAFEEIPRCFNNKCDESTQVSMSDVTKSSASSQIEDSHTDNGWVSVILNFKYEHPNYGTIIYKNAINSTEILVPNDLKIQLTNDGECTINVSKGVSAQITDTHVRLEAELCNVCSQKSFATINVEPLYNKIRSLANSSDTELLRITDSFDKKFVVKYDGKCYKNTNFIKGRCNSVNCTLHNMTEPQKLFLLRRNLSGCKFWDVESYKKKMYDGKEDNRTTVNIHNEPKTQRFFSTTFAKHVSVPPDERYLLPYEHPSLLLSNFKVDKVKELKSCYVKRQVLVTLPSLLTVFPIYNALTSLKKKSDTDFLGNVELSTFLRQLFQELRQHQLEIKEAGRVIPVGEPEVVVSLSQRWRCWREQKDANLNQIREKFVPLYYNSDLRKRLLKDLTPTSSCTCTNSDSIKKYPVSVTTAEVASLSKKLSKDGVEPTSRKRNSSVSKTMKEELEEILNMRSTQSTISKTSRKSKIQEILKTPLAIELLNEIILRLHDFTNNLILHDDEPSSNSKVKYVAEKIYNNIIRVIVQFEDCVKEDLINVASMIIVNNVSFENLSTLEMYLLLDFLKQQSNPVQTCSDAFNDTSKSCRDYFEMSQENKFIKQMRDPSAYAHSAYELYSTTYSLKQEIETTSKPIPLVLNIDSLTEICKDSDEFEEKSSEEIVSDNNILLRQSYINLFQSQIQDNESCQKCIDKTDFLCQYEKLESGQEGRYCPTIERINSYQLSSFHENSEASSFLSVDSSTQVGVDYDSLKPHSHMFAIRGSNPYVERGPEFIKNCMMKATEQKKATVLGKSVLEDDIGFHTCSRCIVKTNESDLSVTENNEHEQVVPEILKDAEFVHALPLREDDTEKNLLDAVKSSLKLPLQIKPHKIRFTAKVSDHDKEYLRNNCPPTFDKALLVKEARVKQSPKILRKSVGIVTQPGVVDHGDQT
ncbi:hypothetical protein FQA39_LY10768 [Lamprigera yunnana]|nr:hypothetical protein FQA39_LY10768 [Lamprigera yunnana]